MPTIDAPYCPGCGYDLRDSRREKCPECGGRQTPLVRDFEDKESRLRRVLRNATAFYVFGAPACLGFLAGRTDLGPAVLLLLVAVFVVVVNVHALGNSLLQRPQARRALWRLWTVFGLQTAAALLLVTVTVGVWIGN